VRSLARPKWWTISISTLQGWMILGSFSRNLSNIWPTTLSRLISVLLTSNSLLNRSRLMAKQWLNWQWGNLNMKLAQSVKVLWLLMRTSCLRMFLPIANTKPNQNHPISTAPPPKKESLRHHTLPKMHFPASDGTQPKIWLDKCNNYLSIYSIPDSLWVEAATMQLEGNATKQW